MGGKFKFSEGHLELNFILSNPFSLIDFPSHTGRDQFGRWPKVSCKVMIKTETMIQ